jgi:hypothetical protein
LRVLAQKKVQSLGDFINYGASWSFVSRLEAGEGDIEKLLSAEPQRAVDLNETFVAGCYEKAGEIDDSSGSFGMLAQDLFRGSRTKPIPLP